MLYPWTPVPVYRPPRCRHPPSIPQFYRQGHLYLEDAVPGWDNTGSIRTGGFHRTVGSAGPQAPRQSNPLSWGTRSKSSLARAGYAGKARQRCEAPPQQGSSFTCWASRGDDLGPAPETRFFRRYWGLRSLWRVVESHRLHWGSGHHRQNPGTSSREGTGSPCPAPPGTANQGATCQPVSFRRKRIDNPKSVRTLLKNAWHELLRTLVQEWADMNCSINSASNFSGLQAGISQISPAQLAASVRKSTLNRPFISPILYPWGLS